MVMGKPISPVTAVSSAVFVYQMESHQ